MTGPLDRRKVKREDAEKLWKLLGDGRFHKAKAIGMESRKIRAVRSMWPHKFLSTQAGYKRVPNATDDEIGNAIADLKSRCGELARCYTALERVLRERHQAPLNL